MRSTDVEPADLTEADRDAIESLSWLCDADSEWVPGRRVMRAEGVWWACDGVLAVAVPGTGDDTTVDPDGVRVPESPLNPSNIAGLTCGLRRWVAATVDREELLAVCRAATPGPVRHLAEQCRLRPGTVDGGPRVDPALLAVLLEHAPESRITVHSRGVHEPVIVTAKGGWRGVVGPLRAG